MSVCVRALRTLYRSNRASPDVIFSDITVVKKLISLVSSSHLIGQCAAIILAKACQVYFVAYSILHHDDITLN